MQPIGPLPTLIVHADWSVQARKRWMAGATLQADGSYRARAPQPVGPTDSLLHDLRAEVGPGACLLAGFDFPIGVPAGYARRAGIDRFLEVLPALGAGQWQDFYSVAATPEQINLWRPFYPARPGGSRREYLVARLEVSDFNALRRRCELARAGRRAAAPLFWTMGAQQVGKAALTGWREVLVPGLQDPGLQLSIWPFSGALPELLVPGATVIAETYPAEYYAQLIGGGAGGPTGDANGSGPSGGPGGSGTLSAEPRARRFSKRNQAHRQSRAAYILSWAEDLGLALEPPLAAAIMDGFSAGPQGEDMFDATIGLFGMLSVVLGQRPAGEPLEDEIQFIEGWILGQA